MQLPVQARGSLDSSYLEIALLAVEQAGRDGLRSINGRAC